MEVTNEHNQIINEKGAVNDLPFVFVNTFADEKSLQVWESSVYRGLPLLSVSMRKISILNPYTHILRIFNMNGMCQEVSNVKRMSMADGNHAVLLQDGKVVADGDNNFGQINVKQLKNIADVISINGCTLAVNNKGRVIVRGYISFKDEIESWKDVAKIWGNTTSVTAINNEGAVLIACKKGGNIIAETFDSAFLSGKAANAVVYEPEPQKPMAAILMEDERVCFIRLDEKEKKLERVPDKRYKAIAAAKETALLLSQNGEVDMLGRDMDEVKEWKNILFLAANENCVVGVDIHRMLHLCGQNYCRRSMIAEKRWAMSF